MCAGARHNPDEFEAREAQAVNVSYSPAASVDLEEIGQTPFAFRQRIELDGRRMRMRPKGAYNIYYTVEDDGVRIQRIIPGAMEHAAALEEGPEDS
jgi:plasmid stabilization system protein ParE